MRKLHCLLMCILLLIGPGLLAQTRQITGKITDAAGLPIPNATIKIKGSRTGTSASSSFNVSLIAENKSLSEVVVTGIETATSKKKVAISVQSISSDKLPSVPEASIDQALVGKIAGAQISSSSGNPGSPASIQLRGPNTIHGGSQPIAKVAAAQVV